MFIDKSGNLYAGDLQQGDRLATPQEIEAWQAAKHRSALDSMSVTRRKFKRALLEIGLLDDVESLISASTDRALQIDWAESLDFERSNPFVAQVATAIGKTSEEIDALFVSASAM